MNLQEVIYITNKIIFIQKYYRKYLKYKYLSNNNIDIMNIIDISDKELLLNTRIKHMSKIDFGKTFAISNQYVHKKILQYKLQKYNYKIYCCDDNDLPDYIDISNNCSGFDLVILNNNTKKYYKVQSKLRQVSGNTDTSQSTHFETTRRNSIKNKNKNHTGHVCYSVNEFDFVIISLINVKKNFDNRINCNNWTFCIIPVKDIIDIKNPELCLSHIPSDILQKNIIDLRKDISHIFM